MKIDLKSSKKKADDEPEIKLKKKETKEIAIKNYLQKCCGCNNLLKYMNPNNEVPTTILYLDENENNIKTLYINLKGNIITSGDVAIKIPNFSLSV